MLFSVVKDPEISANDLNHDLDTICRWAPPWKLEFNPDPTKQATEVLFSCKKTYPLSSAAKLNEQKHLGLVLNSG